MLYGWVQDGERQTGDDDWADAEYYLGDENDGAMKTGWQLISITDENWDEDDDTFDVDQDRWFYFKSNGKRYANTGDKEYVAKTINGKKYGFDANGRMIAEWNIATVVGTQGQATYTREWSYFASPEDGARKTKGWFKVVPDEDLDTDEYNDASEYWYYADGKGKLIANEIKTINGRKYAFDDYGRMMDGLRLVEFAKNTNGTYSTKEIVASYEDDDVAGLYFDTEDNLDATIAHLIKDEDENQYSFMYFGDENDGAMKTGKQTIVIDGDKIDFEFNKNGSKKGQGRNELDDADKVAYAMGKKYKADSDNKYEVVLQLENGVLVSMTAQDYVNDMVIGDEVITKKTNGDDKDKYYLGETGQSVAEDYNGVKVVKTRVVNVSGSLVKTKSKCKDGDDIIIEVKDKEIKAIYEELD